MKKNIENKFYQIKKYFKMIEKSTNLIQCTLCPHNCIIQNNKTGLCKTRKNIGGKFYSLVYGKPCSIHVDPIEKKPLYHFMPGQKVLSLGTFGCNLFCKGCQNYEISRADAELITENLDYVEPKQIIELVKRQNLNMIAFTYNEPTVFFEYMLDIAKLAKKENENNKKEQKKEQKIKLIIVSNGYIHREPLKELCKYIDAANIDIKGIKKEFYQQYAKANIEPILENIKFIHKYNSNNHKVWLELTNLIIPTLNDKKEEIKELCQWVKNNLGTDVPLHFSRFFPYHKIENLPITETTTSEYAEKTAKEIGLNYVYLGNTNKIKNTICKNKNCKNILIERENYSGNIVGLSEKKNNQCKKCKTILDGVF